MPTISYRRISAGHLADLLARQDEDATYTYFNQDLGMFPYTLHHYALDEYWSLLHDFLGIQDDSTAVFWPLMRGSRPIIAAYPASEQEYLTVIDYMTPTEVQTIAYALTQITREESIARYMQWQDIADDWMIWDQDRDDPTSYVLIYALFCDVLCFFQIAAERGDGMLRQYGS